MLQCPHCAYMCVHGSTVCENCGNLITANHPLLYGSATEKLAKKPLSSLLASLILDDELITLIFQHSIQQVRVDTKLFFGRGIPSELQLPLLDLSPAAFVGGISRIHAVLVPIVRGKYQIMDMGSTNGTFIDRRRLAPFKLYYLGDNSELAFGNLHLNVQYASFSEGDNAFVSTFTT